MRHLSPTSLLLNIGHALDHWILLIFAYSWSVIGGAWNVDWTELTPFNYGALFMFGAGSVISGRLGDHWGRWIMMAVFFVGMGLSCLIIALCTNRWQIGAALTLMGAFSSIYHPVGIPMLVQKAARPGIVIGINGLAGNMGIALAAGVSIYMAERFGWQMAFILPGILSLLVAATFVLLVPRETEAPSKRAAKMLDLPRPVMARIFAVMTFCAISSSIIFNFTTNSNGELLRERMSGVAQTPFILAGLLFSIFALASLAQLVVGKLIDRFSLRQIFLPILALQVPLFLIASEVQDWALYAASLSFMLLVFAAIPLTDAVVVRFVDDRMRSRVTGMRLAIGYIISSTVVALIGPGVKAAGFSTLLIALAGCAACGLAGLWFLPDERQVQQPAALQAD